MTAPLGPAAPRAATPDPKPDPKQDAKLRESVRQLQGLFVQQLFKAMRETVPDGGAVGGGAAEETFTALMDEHVAAETPQQWERGLGEALYKALRSRMADGA